MDYSNDLMDVILTGGSSEEISDKIKEILYTKSSENIDAISPYVARSIFGVSEEEE